MTILPVSLKDSRSVMEFFREGGRVEVPRPAQCPNVACGLKQPLWKNGSYARQVIYWGFCFLVQILRFRCRRCGRTASCPYGWLVPYRRFSAEVIAAAIELAALTEMTYQDLSVEVSDLEMADPEMDIRTEELYRVLRVEVTADRDDDEEDPPCRPARATVFHWVDFACKHVEGMLTQLQKELIQELKRGKGEPKLPSESMVENPNSYKAFTAEKDKQLDGLSFLTCGASWLVGRSKQLWYGLRAYFVTRAESRDDILTDAGVRLSTTQTFERSVF